MDARLSHLSEAGTLPRGSGRYDSRSESSTKQQQQPQQQLPSDDPAAAASDTTRGKPTMSNKPTSNANRRVVSLKELELFDLFAQPVFIFDYLEQRNRWADRVVAIDDGDIKRGLAIPQLLCCILVNQFAGQH